MKKIHLILTVMLSSIFFAQSSFAVSEYDTIVAGVNFDLLKAAFATVFAAMVGAGIFIKGGSMIARKLGFR